MNEMVTQEAEQETLPAMTRHEALRTNDAIKSGIKTLRALLLDMRDRKGWLALGYSSFEEYGKAELGYEKSYIYRIVEAACVESSLNELPIGNSIPESHLRPLAPLSDEDRRKAYQEAKAQADEEHRKLTARMVQEAVDRVTAEKEKEKSDLLTQLEKERQSKEEWRKQDNEKLRKLREKEQLIKTAQAEAAALRKTIATEAKKIAQAELANVMEQVDEAKLQKIELENKIKALRKQQDEAVEKRTKEALKAQQDEINRREVQLQTIERKLETARAQMQSIDHAAQVRAHFESVSADIKQHLNDLSTAVQLAVDPDYTDYMPAEFVPLFEKLVREMRDGAKGIEQMLGMVDVRKLEVVVNG